MNNAFKIQMGTIINAEFVLPSNCFIVRNIYLFIKSLRVVRVIMKTLNRIENCPK